MAACLCICLFARTADSFAYSAMLALLTHSLLCSFSHSLIIEVVRNMNNLMSQHQVVLNHSAILSRDKIQHLISPGCGTWLPGRMCSRSSASAAKTGLEHGRQMSVWGRRTQEGGFRVGAWLRIGSITRCKVRRDKRALVRSSSSVSQDGMKEKNMITGRRRR